MTANVTFQLVSSYPQLVFSLTCNTTQYPPTTVSWSRDNEQLNVSSDQWTAVQVLTNRKTTDYTSILTLNTSDTAGYAGTYNCTLSNIASSTFSIISLKGMQHSICFCEYAIMCFSQYYKHCLLPAPESPTSLKVSAIISLSWKHTGGDVKHYRIYNEQLGLNAMTLVKSYSLPELSNQTAYNISVVAVYDLPSLPAVLLVQTGGKHS